MCSLKSTYSTWATLPIKAKISTFAVRRALSLYIATAVQENSIWCWATFALQIGTSRMCFAHGAVWNFLERRRLGGLIILAAIEKKSRGCRTAVAFQVGTSRVSRALSKWLLATIQVDATGCWTAITSKAITFGVSGAFLRKLVTTETIDTKWSRAASSL